MRKIDPLKINYKNGWETVDETKSGYVETSYEWFDYVPSIPLLKAKKADIWHIGSINQYEPKSKINHLFYEETAAQKAFAELKKFQESELSRPYIDGMNESQLETWLIEYGSNPFAGDSLYMQKAISALEFLRPKTRKGMEME